MVICQIFSAFKQMTIANPPDGMILELTVCLLYKEVNYDLVVLIQAIFLVKISNRVPCVLLCFHRSLCVAGIHENPCEIFNENFNRYMWH